MATFSAINPNLEGIRVMAFPQLTLTLAEFYFVEGLKGGFLFFLNTSKFILTLESRNYAVLGYTTLEGWRPYFIEDLKASKFLTTFVEFRWVEFVYPL